MLDKVTKAETTVDDGCLQRADMADDQILAARRLVDSSASTSRVHGRAVGWPREHRQSEARSVASSRRADCGNPVSDTFCGIENDIDQDASLRRHV